MPAKLEIYKASAGSGKTYTLTQKYLGYLLQSANTTHRNILAVTFTNKATEEMKARILTQMACVRRDVCGFPRSVFRYADRPA